ncbi:unnamed protein product [Amoebophrya sp. A25]|nr:unnamed protein product [Amoebophrya sp. A25]|eukprot:GSA25T00021479001.1
MFHECDEWMLMGNRAGLVHLAKIGRVWKSGWVLAQRILIGRMND